MEYLIELIKADYYDEMGSIIARLTVKDDIITFNNWKIEVRNYDDEHYFLYTNNVNNSILYEEMNRDNSPLHEVLTSILLDIVGLDLDNNYDHDDESFTDYCIQIRRIIMGEKYSVDNHWICTGNHDHFYYNGITVFSKADSNSRYVQSVYIDGKKVSGMFEDLEGLCLAIINHYHL